LLDFYRAFSYNEGEKGREKAGEEGMDRGRMPSTFHPLSKPSLFIENETAGSRGPIWEEPARSLLRRVEPDPVKGRS
jgi:hypothetical protein